MDIAAMSIAMNQSKVKQQASLSVMKMAMGNAEQQGAAMQELLSSSDVASIQQAAQAHLGKHIDIKG
ncbi:putative motility protein [Ornithinibacillus gellani]|uniref:YjfB family protein n=1 Tax=Ornithinibacillus gellani TaxID=2293253 RepID=UPI000F48FA67|nr:YjfB family protein [Ornithinibacillus gellani]TQS71870.1 putative motility protein [Ornithinibacillus gellani]